MSSDIPAVSSPEADRRIAKLQRHLQEAGTDGALILQKADLFYFSGTIQDACLYVPAEGAPLFMPRKHTRRACAESVLPCSAPLARTRMIPDILQEHGMNVPRRLGMELDVLPAGLFLSFQKIFPDAEIVDVSPLIRMVRSVKSPAEVDVMAEAARRADQVFAAVSDLLREGMPEVELAGQVEALARSLGHQGVVRMRLWGSELFYGHLMAGPSAAVPSFLASPTGGTGTSPAVAQSAGFRPIQRNEPILVDYVFAWNGYISDQTRIFVIGDLPADLMRGFDGMVAVQEMLKTAARPGVPAGELYRMALDHAEKQGIGDHFMGADTERVRFVGHGVGLELDEFPFLAKGQTMPLQAGMTIALEPKLIFPGRGVVGIENTHLVTGTGLQTFNRFPDAVVAV